MKDKPFKSKYKWRKHHILQKHATLKDSLPETRQLSQAAFWQLLKDYGSVVIKPDYGQQGQDLMLVTQKSPRLFEVHKDKKVTKYTNREKLINFLTQKTSPADYLVQQKIDLANINGSPIDIRVMTKCDQNGCKVTGKLVKVAGEGYFITNMRRSKGYVLPLEAALKRSSIKALDIKAIMAKIDQIALETAKVLRPHYPRWKVAGIDLGVDQKGKVWIIEINYKPSYSLFRHLHEKTNINADKLTVKKVNGRVKQQLIKKRPV